MSKKIIPLMPMAALLAHSFNELIEMAKEGHSMAVEAKEWTSAKKSSTPALGKVYAALKRKFNDDQQKGSQVVASATYEEFIKVHLQVKRIDNHALSCAKCFGFYVGNSLITEADYDKNLGDHLEKAASIVDLCKLDVTDKDILDAADILKDRPKDAAAKLQSIIDRLNGPRKVTLEKAKEYLALLFANAHHMVVLATTSAEMSYVNDPAKLEHYISQIGLMHEAATKRYAALANDMKTAKVVPPAQLPAVVPVKQEEPVIQTETATESEWGAKCDPLANPRRFDEWLEAKIDTKAIGAEYLPAMIEDLKKYEAVHNCLPDNEEDFLAFSESLHPAEAAA